MRAMLSRFFRNNHGATILEFAVVAPFFFVMAFGILEIGLYMFHKVAIESITAQAGREASLVRTSKGNPGDPCYGKADQIEYIRCIVKSKSDGLANKERIFIDVQRVDNGGAGTFAPDICVDNPNAPTSTAPTCTLFEDVNGNNKYDPANSSLDAGTYGQLVEVRVNYPWKLLIPGLSQFIGRIVQTPDGPARTNVIMITSSIVIRNEPL